MRNGTIGPNWFNLRNGRLNICRIVGCRWGGRFHGERLGRRSNGHSDELGIADASLAGNRWGSFDEGHKFRGLMNSVTGAIVVDEVFDIAERVELI